MLIQPASLRETAAQLRSGERDLPSYLETTLDRLGAIEPQMRALVPEGDRRERLLREAADLQARYPHPSERPPLYGVLIGVKDIFRAEGFDTRAGSTLPPELFVGEESPIVSRLKALGALILGKTVTAEFAYIEPGPTRNPHNLAHTPGGSSSGSAATVAAGLCALATGTQTIGSIIRPASYCGIVGFKPSFGRLSTAGVIPVSRSLDHVGVFTQDAAGMELAASLLCADWHPIHESRRPTIGIVGGPYLAQADQNMVAAFEDRLQLLERAGYRVQRIDEDVFGDIAAVNAAAPALMAYEAAQVHAEWFARYSDRYRPLTSGLIRRGQTISDAEAQSYRTLQAETRARLHDRMQRAGIDLWVSPAATGAAPHGLGSTGNSIMNLPWTFTGLPTITLPAGKVDGLPVGMQWSAAFGADEQLIAWTIAMETV
ncbi:MAG: amidase [Anaerolineae bacterium]